MNRLNMLLYASGTVIIIAAGLDIYLTILYARSGTGLLSPRINRTVWQIFRQTAMLISRKKDIILSFCGPTLIVILLALWVFMFVTGFALVIWPQLGKMVKSSSGPTPTNFISALYYSGYSFSTLGTGNLVPKNDFYRLLMIIQSVIGFSFFTLVITYFLNVFNALHRRNIFALTLHNMTMGTANPSEYISRIGSDPDLIIAQQQFATLSTQLSDLLESHHFYPILHYFRFLEIQYGLPRILLITLDAISLFKSALDENLYYRQINSAAVDEAWNSGMALLSYFSNSLIPEGFSDRPEDREMQDDRWRNHYFSSLEKLRNRDIETRQNPEEGFLVYTGYRKRWNHYITALCHDMLYDEQDLIPFEY